jgi:hypothetical protein
MLDRMKPGEFETWWREHEREPWGDEWLRMSVSTSAIINEIRARVIKEIKKDDLLPLDHWMPKPTDEEQQPVTTNSGNSLAAMRARIGV